jgi:hypothetical protein
MQELGEVVPKSDGMHDLKGGGGGRKGGGTEAVREQAREGGREGESSF